MSKQVKESEMNTKNLNVKHVGKTDTVGSGECFIRCRNRFEVLTDLQEDGEYKHGEDEWELTEQDQSTCTASSDSSNDAKNIPDNETHRSQVVVECDEQSAEDNCAIEKNESKVKIDIKNTALIVKATLKGSKCVRNVIVINIEAKCTDLKKVYPSKILRWGFFL